MFGAKCKYFRLYHNCSGEVDQDNRQYANEQRCPCSLQAVGGQVRKVGRAGFGRALEAMLRTETSHRGRTE